MADQSFGIFLNLFESKKLKKLPSVKLNEQRPNVMITLPERRLNDYENLE